MDSYCRNCGEPIDAGDRFCGVCGTAAREVTLVAGGVGALASTDPARHRFHEVFKDADQPEQGDQDDPAHQKFQSVFATLDESPDVADADHDLDSSSGGGIVALVLSVAALPVALLLAQVGLVVLLLGGLGGLVAGISGHSASRPGSSDRGFSDAGAIIGGLEAGFALLVLISRA